ncbi:hypothetical protein OAE77_00195 [bacterium]|nr:hypothetical protein [bacterium]
MTKLKTSSRTKQRSANRIPRRLFVAQAGAMAAAQIGSAQQQTLGVDKIQQQLQNSHWPKLTAQSVATTQSSIQEQIALSDPKAAERRLNKIKALGKYPVVMRLLANKPEMAGFLIQSINPMRDAETLESYSSSREAFNTLKKYAANFPDMIEVLRLHKKSLLRLPQDGEPEDYLPVELFLNTGPKDRDYKQFVEQLLAWTQGNSTHRHSVEGSLTRCSAEVRNLFRTKPKDTTQAASDWLKFLERHPDYGEWIPGVYFEIDALLRFFSRPSAIQVAEHSGIKALQLYEKQELPNSLREVLAQAILKSDPVMLDTISSLSNDPRLTNLLSRTSLPPSTLKAALLAAAQNTDKLSQWMNMTDTAVSRDVGTSDLGAIEYIPFAEITSKIIDGREITAIDGVFVALDAASIVFPLAKGGSAGLRTIGAVAKKDVIEIATKTGGKTLAKRASKMTAKEIQQKLPDLFEEAVKKTTAQGLKKGALDITNVMRFAYQKIGKRSKTFKKFTKLEARVFMRSDRTIVIYPHKTAIGIILAEVVGEAVLAIATTEVLESKSARNTMVYGLTKSAEAYARLNAIWIACNEPDSIGEILSSANK